MIIINVRLGADTKTIIMERIGIAQLKSLVAERVANPLAFEGKTLVLWNGHYTQEYIIYHIIRDCCIEFNKSHSEEDARWHRYSDMTFRDDDNTKIEEYRVLDRVGCARQGILFNTGCCLRNEVEEWLKFINTHINRKGKLSRNWALIACAHATDYGFTTDSFGSNCEIVEFMPTVEEFEAHYAPKLPKAVFEPAMAYIKKNGFTMHPYYWVRVMNEHKMELLEEEHTSLQELSEEDFMGSFHGSEVITDYYNFVHASRK